MLSYNFMICTVIMQGRQARMAILSAWLGRCLGFRDRMTAEGGKRVLCYSGEDAASKARVAELIDQLGFYGIDLGGVQQGLLAQFPGGPLPALNLIKHG